MILKRLKHIIYFFIFIGSILGNAQNKTIEIKGKVLEAESKQTIEYATISILDVVTKKPVTGTITNEKGVFSIDVKATNFYIEVSFLGFTTKTFKTFNVSILNTLSCKLMANLWRSQLVSKSSFMIMGIISIHW